LLETGTIQKLLHTLGLTPLEVAKSYDAIEYLHADQTARKERIGTWGALAAEALEAEDYEAYATMLRKAMIDGANPYDVTKSAVTRTYKNTTEVLDRQFEKFKAHTVRESRGLGKEN
jgi:hypothetical protein